MRYATMEHLPLAPMASRKRPRHDDLDAVALPPLHAFHNHHAFPQQQLQQHQQPTPAFDARPMLPTLSQVLRPSMQFSVLAPPPASQHGMYTSMQQQPIQQHPIQQQQQIQYVHQQATPVARSLTSSPSPPASEVSMEDDDEAEDKTPWPTANEYYDLLTDESRKAHIPVYDLGVDPRGVPLQPEFIYNEPRSCMYFLKCSQLLGRGSFGFPRKKKTTVTTKNAKGAIESVRRCDSTKEFEWRKMSFVTGLPKKQPLVRYITATCYSKTHRSSSEKKKVMRMHAVMLANEEGAGENGDYVLVHIRAGGSKRVGVRTNAVTPAAATSTPVASPTRMESSPVSSSIHSLLSAHNQVMMMSAMERPATPLMYNNYQTMSGSTSPMNKRLRSDMLPAMGGACPRQMPLWLSPPSSS